MKPDEKTPTDDSYDVEYYDYNISKIDEEMARIAATAHGAATEYVATVPASGWVMQIGLSSQTIEVPGVNSNTTVVMQYPVNIGISEMDAILAVALGGNSLSGGKFSISASILGAYVIQFLTTTLYKFNVQSDALPAYKAVVVILLVILSAPIVREKLAALFKKLRTPAKAESKS
jgi:hypothetical protein